MRTRHHAHQARRPLPVLIPMTELTDELKAELQAKGCKLVFDAGALGFIGLRVPPYADYRRFVDKYGEDKKTGPLEELLIVSCVYPADKGATLKKALEQNPGRLITWGARLQKIAQGGEEDEGKEL